MKKCPHCKKEHKKRGKFCSRECYVESVKNRRRIEIKEAKSNETVDSFDPAIVTQGDITENIFSVPDKIVFNLKNSVDWVTIVPVGDIHKYSPSHSERAWNEFLEHEREAVKEDPHRYYIFLGDELECFAYRERQRLAQALYNESSRHIVDEMMYKYADGFFRDIEFMGGRVIGMSQGNHGYIFGSGESLTHYLCRRIAEVSKGPRYNCWFLGTLAGMMFVFRYSSSANKKAYHVWVAHGEQMSGGRLLGASVNTLERMANNYEGDLYIKGHDHRRGANETIKLQLTGNKGSTVRVDERAAKLVSSGSFLKSYEKNKGAYSHGRGWAAVPLGDPPVIKIRMKKTSDGHRLIPITKVTT